MSTNRPYRSTLREERARDTRLRIRKSARRLFATHGFSKTTIAQIAEDAGVAPQTIYAVFGSKGGVVGEMLEDLEESADQDAWVAGMLAEQDPHRQLRIFVSWIRTFFEKGAPVLRAAVAARSDPEVAAMAERGDDNRRKGTAQLTHVWSRKGVLHKGLKPTDAAERLWLLTSVEQYLVATDGLGWTPDHYERWLGDLLERELLEAETP
ncbi:MAG: TetR/AcrR family transcriptional regulator [Acidimicrobiia bacterium]